MRKHAQCYFNIYCLCSYKPTVASTWAHWRWKITIFSKFSKPFLNILWSGTWKIDISVLWKRFLEHWIEVHKGQCACLSERERDVSGKLEYWTFETPEHRTPESCVNLRNPRGTFHLKPLRNLQESFSLFTVKDVFRFDIGQEWKFNKNKNKLILD